MLLRAYSPPGAANKGIRELDSSGEWNAPGGYAPPGSPPPDALAECQDIIIDVTFVDASTLAQLSTWNWQADGFMEYGWTPDDEFYVQTVDETWRVDPTTGPEPAVAPECLNPKTTSSSVSAGGVYLQTTTDPANPIEASAISDIATFGNCSGS